MVPQCANMKRRNWSPNTAALRAVLPPHVAILLVHLGLPLGALVVCPRQQPDAEPSWHWGMFIVDEVEF